MSPLFLTREQPAQVGQDSTESFSGQYQELQAACCWKGQKFNQYLVCDGDLPRIIHMQC